MGYRLIQDETLPRGLKRIAREEIDFAIEQLSTKERSKLDPAIHEARKSIKKLRGLMRMLAPALGPPAVTDIATLGEVGRSLSELRDAAALVEAVDLLSSHTRDARNLELLGDLRRTLHKRARETMDRSEVHIVCEQGIMQLRHVKRGMAAWKPEDTFDTIAPGLKKSFRRGRKALKLAREEPTADNFHILRKRVKDRWYQSRILESLWYPPAKSPEGTLGELQEDLGDDHNLNVLLSYIPAESIGLLRLVSRTQKRLRSKSLDSAAPLYSQQSGEFVAELKAYWEEWRPTPKIAKIAEVATRRAHSAA